MAEMCLHHSVVRPSVGKNIFPVDPEQRVVVVDWCPMLHVRCVPGSDSRVTGGGAAWCWSWETLQQLITFSVNHIPHPCQHFPFLSSINLQLQSRLMLMVISFHEKLLNRKDPKLLNCQKLFSSFQIILNTRCQWNKEAEWLILWFWIFMNITRCLVQWILVKIRS